MARVACRPDSVENVLPGSKNDSGSGLRKSSEHAPAANASASRLAIFDILLNVFILLLIKVLIELRN